MAGRIRKAIKSIAHSKYLQRLLLSYLILLALLISSSTIIYTNLLSKLRSENEAKFESVFETTCTLLDERINEAIKISDTICTNSQLNHFLLASSADTSKLISDLNTVSAWLADYSQTGSIIADYYIYDFTHEAMICPGGCTFRLAQQYAMLFRYGTLSYEEWKTQILEHKYYHAFFPNAEGYMNNKKGEYPLLVTSIYPRRGTAHIGQLVMRLDPTVLEGIISKTESSFESFEILDGNGNILLSSGAETDSKSKAYTFVSSVKDLTYTAKRIQNSAETRIVTARNLTNIVMIVSALLGFVLSCIMAYTNSKQVIHIHASVSGSEETQKTRLRLFRNDTELNAIDRSIRRLIDSSRDLEKRVTQQNLLLRESFNTRLVYSYFYDSDDINKVLENEHMLLQGSVFCGAFALIYISEAEKLDAALQEARYEIERHTDYVNFCIPVDHSKLAFLTYGYDPAIHAEQLGELLHSVHDYLADAGIHVRFCIGKQVNGISEIRSSFIDAERIVAVTEYTGSNEVISKAKKVSGNAVIDNELVLRVKEYAIAGNAEALNTLLDEIFKSAFETEAVEQFRVKTAMYELSAALMEACAQLEINADEITEGLSELPEMSPGTEAFAELRRRYSRLCAMTAERKKLHGNEVCGQVEQWVREHYSDCDLTITDIADHFGLNERYLTGLYKDYSGTTLWNFVIDLRIAEAARLLADPDLSVSEVAKRVGYLNVGSFRRMYKQHTSGGLPSEKRKN